MFTADQVWGAAAAAQRINGEYLKEDQGRYTDDGWVVDKRANKMIVKDWLRNNDFSQITEVDYAAGRTARDHFKSYTLLALKGTLNEFQSTAMRIASMDEFTGKNMYEFSVVSCLPSVAVRDKDRSELKREIYASEQIKGQPGEVIIGDLNVVTARYNRDYNKYRIMGRMGEAFVDFWFSKALEGSVRIKGKIKQLRGDNTTQLNYVKIIG
jgi:hypothetical protein